MSLHSLYEQSVWCCDYFSKINPKSNSISIVQIFKLVSEKGVLNQNHKSCEKVGKIWPRQIKIFSFMLSLIKLKLCRMVHQGTVSNR